jgi:rare lipoprotein A
MDMRSLIATLVFCISIAGLPAAGESADRPDESSVPGSYHGGAVTVSPDRLPVPEPPTPPGDSETGMASWYGGKFQGRQTASGEVFDTEELTAAHKTLPFGTRVRVVNTENGESVVVRINDRGPFVEGRIIDLSRAAAREIGMTGSGVTRVRLEVVERPAAKEHYLIQVGSFSNPDNAHHLTAELRNAGIPAEIRESNRGFHRVVVANVPAASLGEYRDRLERAGYPDVIVR